LRQRRFWKWHRVRGQRRWDRRAWSRSGRGMWMLGSQWGGDPFSRGLQCMLSL
jgi:hypothetical protein